MILNKIQSLTIHQLNLNRIMDKFILFQEPDSKSSGLKLDRSNRDIRIYKYANLIFFDEVQKVTLLAN